MNEIDYLEVVGASEYLAAKVAATFPKEFAETLKRWYASDISAIIEALTEQKEG